MKQLDPRSLQVLFAVIEDYITTALPVGSLDLAAKYGIDASSATIRNDMARLEAEGFLEQPYTSAGRVPTEKAYRRYLEQCSMEAAVLPKYAIHRIGAAIQQLRRDRHNREQLRRLKDIVKMVAEMTKDLVVIEFEPNDIYYTGLAHLLEQPEFDRIQAVTPVGYMMDHVDEMVGSLREICRDDIDILIGNQNPFDRRFSVIASRYRIGNSDIEGIIGIIGPMRMPYEQNIAIVKYIKDQLAF